ncbi:MAG: PadR family transcriptional regulator, partial [Actinomycetota bacterium]|nr:PadR family transcriptional regulator [Actinomycetota bacterium]
WAQHGWGGGSWGGWAGGPGSGHGRRGGPGGPGGPPPWLAGLFGMGQPDQRRGPRVKRGDVRSAILDVLREAAEREEPINGYQVIQQIADKSNGAWRPSPGSVYPTIQQLQDEGLVEEDQERGRRSLRLTAVGTTYVHEHSDELDAVWEPFERSERAARESGSDFADLKPEIGQVMGAVWQILTQGSEQQRAAAIDILVDTRRRLYGVLADGTDPETDETGDES